MTIPHRCPQERPAKACESGAGEPREPGACQPGPVTYDDAARRYGPGLIGARERYDELSMRDHLARAAARLRASGEYDAARHGTGGTEPLTAAERLELLATAEYLARAYKPSFETDNALRAGAGWAQVADSLGTGEAAARAAYRAWADGQHDKLTWTAGRLGMRHAKHAEAMRRIADGAGSGGAFERAAAGPGAILCAPYRPQWRGGALAGGRGDLPPKCQGGRRDSERQPGGRALRRSAGGARPSARRRAQLPDARRRVRRV
jgi:hypothetical protein